MVFGTLRSMSEHMALSLGVTAEKMQGIEPALGPGGLGTFVVSNLLTSEQLECMQIEIFDPKRVQWRDNHDRFTNRRGVEVVENHTVFALKLKRGNMRPVEQVPHMRALAGEIEGLVQSLNGIFPNLQAWEADEMSLHRYDDPDIGISFHKDNLRFIGLIAVLTLEGESDVLVKQTDGTVQTISLGAGDLNLTRATSLYDSFTNGRLDNLCPEHAVVNLRTPFRTSFIVRANSRPDDVIPGFSYDNWAGEN